MPAALNHSAMSRLSAAAPEMKRTRPPKRSRIFEKTRLSKSVCCRDSGSRTDLPSRLSCWTWRPTLKAWLKIFSLRPPSDACIVMIRPWAFSRRSAAPHP